MPVDVQILISQYSRNALDPPLLMARVLQELVGENKSLGPGLMWPNVAVAVGYQSL